MTWADSEEFKNLILQAGVYAPFLLIFYFTIADIIAPLAGSPGVILGGIMFGAHWTLVYIYISSVLSGVICFYISKKFGRKLVLKLVGRKTMKQIDDFSEASGNKMLILSRIFGSAINDIVSYAFGLTSMEFKPYFIITLIFSAVPYFILGVIFTYFEVTSVTSALIWLGSITLTGIIFSYFIKKFLKKR